MGALFFILPALAPAGAVFRPHSLPIFSRAEGGVTSAGRD